jgi:hypothetical protein
VIALGFIMLGWSLFFYWVYTMLKKLLIKIQEEEANQWRQVTHRDFDYWDGEDLDGGFSPNAGTEVGYRKNVERADSGSVERFHHGGW